MNDALTVYLRDHAAGAEAALELLDTLEKDHEGEALGRFAVQLLADIRKDLGVLEQLIERTGASPGKTVKKTVIRLITKGSRLKLRRGASNGLGTLEILEALSLGILGKLALWQALEEVVPSEPRLQGIDLARLIKRAQVQHAHVERLRLKAARNILSARPAK